QRVVVIVCPEIVPRLRGLNGLRDKNSRGCIVCRLRFPSQTRSRGSQARRASPSLLADQPRRLVVVIACLEGALIPRGQVPVQRLDVLPSQVSEGIIGGRHKLPERERRIGTALSRLHLQAVLADSRRRDGVNPAPLLCRHLIGQMSL